MELRKKLGKEIILLDGAMGTMIQRLGGEIDCQPEILGIRHPQLVEKIHRLYIDAGAQILYANTFGVNRLKIKDSGYSVDQVVQETVGAAQRAAEGRALVALDMGPIGRMLEPTGTLPFDEAVDIYAEVVKAGKAAGADLIVIETMTDLYEVKAAILAAKENSDLPIFVTMTFEENGRTFSGCTLESFAMTAEGLGVDAIGINCSLGPVEILPLVQRLSTLTSLPVIAKPNAGLPHPKTGEYTIDADIFAKEMGKYPAAGASVLGGCCGSDPTFIAKLGEELAGKSVCRGAYAAVTRVCTPTTPVTVDRVRVIGERINPTGKKRLQQALRDGDMQYILEQAIAQTEAGAEVLDINTGLPGIDEAKTIVRVIRAVQSVVDVPLQIDSSDPLAIEAALRIINGKAIVNSVNGDAAVLSNVLPLVKKYGACVVGLTLDENGIPESAGERIRIAQRILDAALSYGIPKEDVLIDCLTLTVSAQPEGARQTLEAMEYIHREMGLQTVLGVSNISFGLPARALVNRAFLSIAMAKGLTLPIINPNSSPMMEAVDAFRLLYGQDENARVYIEKYGDSVQSHPEKEKPAHRDIAYTVAKGLEEETGVLCRQLLETVDEMTVVNDHLIPALDAVGEDFEKGRLFLPQLIRSAAAAQRGFDCVKEKIASKGSPALNLGSIVIATVHGDIHDIGKNIVKVILENYGYRMTDLGRDVPPEKIVEAVKEQKISLVGLSSLMTTTLPAMAKTIALLRQECPWCKIFVGGAVLTPEYAAEIGADFYAKDAKASVDIAKKIFSKPVQ